MAIISLDKVIYLMDRFNIKLPNWLAFIVIGCCIYVAFRQVIHAPNRFLVSGGDGMKNYYTFMYHIKHDSSYVDFEGMNYPFGEHITFTDNQPILVNATKLISQVVPSITCYLPAVHNLAMIFGFWIGIFGVYMILRKLNVGSIFGLIATCALCLIHPQMDRFYSHFGMFYPVLPWLFYHWLHIWRGEAGYRRHMYIGLIILVGGMLHMYHFIVGVIFCAIALASMMLTPGLRQRMGNLALGFVIQAIIPFTILTGFTTFFHTIHDRPNAPWGFFHFHSYLEGLLFSYRMPLFHFVNNNITKVRTFDDEGKAYIGIAAVVFLLVVLFKYLRWSNARFSVVKAMWAHEYARFMFVAIAAALVSFGLPFTIDGFEYLLDYTGPFKQFRSIGRVAWITFYAINFLAIPFIYRMLMRVADEPKRILLMASVLGVMCSEAWFFFKSKTIYQNDQPAYTCSDTLAPLPINVADYQALLPDPFFHIGSESYSWWDQAGNVGQNFELSYRLGIPTMGCNMSRTSFLQARMLCQLTNEPHVVPEVIQLLKKKDTRPLLVVESKNTDIMEARAKLTHWTKDAPIVFENASYRLRKLDLSAFDTIVEKYNYKLASSTMAGPIIRSKFEKVFVEGWAYQSGSMLDSTAVGQRTLEYWFKTDTPAKAAAITDIWTFDGQGNQLTYQNEGNRFAYKQFGDDFKSLIRYNVDIKPGATKIIVRVYTDKMKEGTILDLGEMILR